MKLTLPIIIACLFFSSCQLSNENLDLSKIKNPEKDILKIHSGFKVESIIKEDLDYDGNMDITIMGYDANDNWMDWYFMHNGDAANTYRCMTGDEYWDNYDYEGYDTYEKVEDYFLDIEDYNDIEQIVYDDLNDDGIDDALVIAYYNSEDFYSIDAYIFTGVEEGYYYEGMAEMHYPMNLEGFSVFQNVVVKDGYFTIELGSDEPYWDRYITFKYDENEGVFLLHKDGGIVMDQNGNTLREGVLTQDDFGTIYFYDFMPDRKELFSIKQESRVSNVRELLAALSNNQTIYLSEGIYYLNDLSQLPKQAQENLRETENWDTFYSSEYYSYYGSNDYDSELALTIHNLRNVDFIGLGEVQLVVTDEMISVLSLEECEDLYFENIYMVHDVGGVCGANVIDLSYCYNLEFYECTFDGSGELAVYADASYTLLFTNSYFTNCTDGALDFYDSDAVFETCLFEDNKIWHSLVSAYSYSSLDFYECTFSANEQVESEYLKDPRYLFFTQDESYIYLDELCAITQDNYVDELVNDADYVSIEDGVRF